MEENKVITLAPCEQTGEYSIVRPVVTPEEAVKRFHEYQQLESILSDDDYFYFVEWTYYEGNYAKKGQFGYEKKEDAEKRAIKEKGTVKRRKKKSACRKLATFFNLSQPTEDSGIKGEYSEVGAYIVEKISGKGYLKTVWHRAEDLAVIKAEVSIWVQAPNGRTQIGEGVCSSAERGFKNANHDIPATAFTRALNRAILDLVGFGEVSAEEISTVVAPARAELNTSPISGAIASPGALKREIEASGELDDPLNDAAPVPDEPDYPKIVLTKTDGKKTKPLTKYECLPLFAKIRTALGDELYYSILNINRYEHANEIPLNKIESIWNDLVQIWKNKQEEK